MSFSTRWLYIFFCLFIIETFGFTPPVANPAIHLSPQPLSLVNASRIKPSTSSASNSSYGLNGGDPSSLDNDTQVLSYGTKIPICDGKLYGYDLNVDSCLDAWAKIPIDDQIVTYGARSQGHFEAPLPVRYLSSDGKCYIDITSGRGVITDFAKNRDVSTAAEELIDACVLRDKAAWHSKRPIGGRLAGVGDEGGLSLSVGVYSVDHVECFANRPFNDDGKCSTLLNTLQISPRRFLWLRRPGGQKLGDEDFRGCTATVYLAAREVLASPREIWAGAVAVNEMCVKKGMSGAAYSLGFEGRVQLRLGP